MKVILLEELKGRGGEGDVIDVATGYAVNYLLPKKIAIVASAGNLKQLELRKHNIAAREALRLDTADKLVEALEGQKIRIAAKVGEEGQLFGSITAQQISEAIAEKFDTKIDRRKIDIHGLIKTAGEHQVTIQVYREQKAVLTVEVVDEKAGEEVVAADEAVDEVSEGAEGAAEGEAAVDAVAEAAVGEPEGAEAAVGEVVVNAAAEVETVVETAAEVTEAVEAIEEAPLPKE